MRRVGLIGGILVLIILFFALNLLAGVGVRGARVDLTEGRAFTLTSGSREIARSFEEPVKLTLYYSSKLAQGQPQYQGYYQRVHEMLEEYTRAGKGKIKLEVVDPEPFSDAEDAATAAGLQGVPVGPQESIYFGLVGVNSVDTREVIPFFHPARENFLEYDISRMLYSLGHPKRKTIGLISSLPIQGGFDFDPRTRQPLRTPSWQIVEEARKQFEIKPLGQSIKSVEDNIDVLWLVHPQKLDDATLYAIDQFVMKGGKLIAFVDPLCENQESQQQQGMPTDRASHLEKLLDAWGIEVAPGKLAADKATSLEVQMGDRNRPELVQFVVWLGLKKDQMAKDDPITGQLQNINIGTGGIIQVKPQPPSPPGQTPPPAPPHATITPLLHTSATAMEMPAEVMGMQPDPKAMLKIYTPGTEELVIAARLSGEVPSAFPNGAPPPAENSANTAPPAPGLAKSNGSINVILVADVDMLSDGLWVRQQNFLGQTLTQKLADNGDFVLNAFENLSGSSDLMSIRARKSEQRPFEVVDKMRREAQDRFRAQEDELMKKLQATEAELQKLQAEKGKDNQFVLSADQQKALEKFRAEYASTNKQLRQVRLSLNKDIEGLGTRLKFINIGLIPVVVSLGALGLGAFRAARRRQAPKRA